MNIKKGELKIKLIYLVILFLSFYNFGTIFSPFRVSLLFIGGYLVDSHRFALIVTLLLFQDDALKHESSGLCLDVPSDGSVEKGLIVNPCDGAASQKWKLVPVPWN